MNFGHQRHQPRLELPVARAANLQRQAQGSGDRVRFVQQALVFLLNQIDEPGVVGEIDILERGEAIQTQPLEHGALEAAHQKIGQEKGTRLLVQAGLNGRATVHFIAVRTGDARHIVALEHLIQSPTGTAIAINHDDALKSWNELAQPALDIRADARRNHVIQRGHTEQRYIPLVALSDRDDLAGQRAAQDEGNLREF